MCFSVYVYLCVLVSVHVVMHSDYCSFKKSLLFF
uniref:Uncharacterized protein n=1 Tax=Rhizophora mucronata TaxID=61149 RepID=A0A2P2QQN0_RHIMU